MADAAPPLRHDDALRADAAISAARRRHAARAVVLCLYTCCFTIFACRYGTPYGADF